jgi:hypothetical protein
VIPGIQPIIDAQVQLRDQIVGVVGSVTTPVADKLRDTIFTPLLGMVLGPMGDAFKVGWCIVVGDMWRNGPSSGTPSRGVSPPCFFQSCFAHLFFCCMCGLRRAY